MLSPSLIVVGGGWHIVVYALGAAMVVVAAAGGEKDRPQAELERDCICVNLLLRYL